MCVFAGIIMTEIRDAKEEDWIKIERMMVDLRRFESQYDPTYSVDDKTVEFMGTWAKSELDRKTGVTVVAEEDDVLIGFACGWIEEKPVHLYTEGRIGYFSHLFVTENFRGKGVGRMLAETILDFFRRNRIRFVTVETHVDNTASQELYKDLGFKEIMVNLLCDLN